MPRVTKPDATQITLNEFADDENTWAELSCPCPVSPTVPLPLSCLPAAGESIKGPSTFSAFRKSARQQCENLRRVKSDPLPAHLPCWAALQLKLCTNYQQLNSLQLGRHSRKRDKVPYNFYWSSFISAVWLLLLFAWKTTVTHSASPLITILPEKVAHFHFKTFLFFSHLTLDPFH